MSYETNVDAMLAGLITLLEGCSSLSSDTVHKGFFAQVDTYPAAQVMPRRDSITTAGTLSDHVFSFDILLYFRGGDNTPAADVDAFIAFVGEVWDAIEAVQCNSPTWSWALVPEIDFSFGADKSFIFYIAHLVIELKRRW